MSVEGRETMDTTDIHLVRTVSAVGSITRAAQALHMSQPTLSRKLARLESRLNAQLFHRSPTGLVPTAIAEYVIRTAQPIESQLRRIERHVEQLTQLDAGTVRLGVGPIIEEITEDQGGPQFAQFLRHRCSQFLVCAFSCRTLLLHSASPSPLRFF